MRFGALQVLLLGQLSSAFGAAPEAALGNVDLQVARSEAASDCPTAAALRRAVATHLTEPVGEAVAVRIAIDSQGGTYWAEMQVSGAWQGVRTLQVAGKSCGPLKAALTVALTVLLDPNADFSNEPLAEAEFPDMETEVEPQDVLPEPSEPAPRTELAPHTETTATPRRSSTHQLRGAIGPTLLVGVLPEAALGAQGSLEWGKRSWWVELGGGWFPAQALPRDSGTVTLDFAGARGSACLAWHGQSAWQLGACGLLLGGRLAGRATNFEENRAVSRSFWALGGGGRLRGPVVGPVTWALQLDALVPLQQETFSIEGLGPIATTRRLAAWMGLQLLVQIW